MAVLKLYAQKDIENGDVLNMEEARTAFSKLGLYPSYSLYIVGIAVSKWPCRAA